MSDVKPCRCCSVITGFIRKALCGGSRRSSSESYYRELGDQDTLKIDGSLTSEEFEIHNVFPPNASVHDSEEDLPCQVEDTACALDDSSAVATVVSPQPRPQSPVEVAPDTGTVVTVEAHITFRMTRFRPMGRFLSMHKRHRKQLLTRSLLVQEALLDDLLIGQVQCILNQCATWHFNAFTLDIVAGGRGLTLLCVHLFHIYGLISHFRLDPAKIWKLFSLFEENYHSTNPYHNSIHAADVTQAMHCFLQQKQILTYMEPIEVLAGLLAAIAHDLDHPGVNQPFLVATSNHLVRLYQSKSVLENHHWRSAISCLIESQILEEIPQLRQQLEDKIRSLILATDITRQQDYLGKFKVYLDTKTLDLTCADHRHLVLQMALKCADISNPCRPWDISQTWSLKVCEEFFRQGDVERRLNLPLTPLCDRNSNTVPKIQTGFFQYVVTPLITEWHRFLKSDLSEQMLKNLVTNHKRWDSFSKEDMPEAETEAGEEELDSSGHFSDSSDPLLPKFRRASLAQPPRKAPLRRLSVPLNLLRRENDLPAIAPPNLDDDSTDNSLSSPEKLVSETSIASITTSLQAQRISHVFKWKLVRQPTFPPLELNTRAHSLIPRASSHDDSLCPRASKSEGGLRFESRSDSPKTGTRLHENLTAWHHEFSRRRKSMPAEGLIIPRQRRFRELRDVLPQLLARTLTSRDSRGRRGSAPASGASDRSGSGQGRRGCGSERLDEMVLPRRSSLPVEVMTGACSASFLLLYLPMIMYFL